MLTLTSGKEDKVLGGDLSGPHSRMHIGAAGDTEWNRVKWLCVIFYVNGVLLSLYYPHCSLLQALHWEYTWNPKCIVDSSWKKWVSVRGCKRACAWLQGSLLHRNKAVLTLPVSPCCAFLLGLLRRPFAHAQHWQDRGWNEVPLFFWRVEVITRRPLPLCSPGRNGTCSPPSTSCPAAFSAHSPCWRAAVARVRSQPGGQWALEIISTSGTAAAHGLCFTVSYFQSPSVCNLDCQSRLSMNSIPSGNRPLWKYPHVYERHTIFFLWKDAFCHCNRGMWLWCDPDILVGTAELKSFKLKSLDKSTPLLMCSQMWQSDCSIICYLPKQNLTTLIETWKKWSSNKNSSPNKARQSQVIFITNSF